MDLPGDLAGVFRVNAISRTRPGPEAVTLLIELVFELLQLFCVIFQKPFVVDRQVVVMVQLPLREGFKSLHFLVSGAQILSINICFTALIRDRIE